MKGYWKKMLSAVLFTAVTAGSLGGCTGKAGKDTDGTDTAMGRYLEEEVSMPEGVKTLTDLGILSDGTLRIVGGTDTEMGVYDSADGGTTWKKSYSLPIEEEEYPTNIRISPDGEVGMIILRNSETMDYVYRIADSQGTLRELPVALPGSEANEGGGGETEAETGVTDANNLILLEFGRDGLLYGADTENSIYRINTETGDLEKTYSLGTWIDQFLVMDDRLLVISEGTVEYYDLETGESLGVDETMTERIGESGSDFMVSGLAPVLLQRGEEGSEALYFCDETGLYRHVVDGSVSEQIIDGALNSLANPSMGLIGMAALEDGSFVIGAYEEEKAKILRYTFSKDTPARPSTEVKVYALEDNTEVRQAISMYQKEHPDIFVSMEIGVTGEDGVTVSDALRTLNTNIAAGKGPDILILDGMPVDSYIEKGLLEDLSEILDRIAQSDGLYENITDTYRSEKGTFAVPARFSIPAVQGEEQYLDQIEDLETLAAQADQMRKEMPDASYILDTSDPETLMQSLYSIDSAFWMQEDGSLDEQRLAQFYSWLKQIYDLDEHGEEDTESSGVYTTTVGGGSQSAMEDIGSSAITYFYGKMQLNIGAISSMSSFATAISVGHAKDEVGYKTFGKGGKYMFLPTEILGISSKSKNMEAAKGFVEYLLSIEAQAVNQGGGFPVNKTGFEKSLENRSGVENVEFAISDDDGGFASLALTWPEEEEIKTLRQTFEKLNTPLVTDDVIREAVTEQGLSCLEGGVTAQEAAKNALQKINLYLAE